MWRPQVTGFFTTDKSMHSLLVLSRVQALDELCESTCWSQLGCHARPIGLLNVNGFFAGFVKQVERGVSAGFIHEAYGRMHTVAEEPNQVCLAKTKCGIFQDSWLGGSLLFVCSTNVIFLLRFFQIFLRCF